MEIKPFKLILGSQSPRRKELLKATFLDFEIMPSDVEEITSETQPDLFAMDLAKLKGEDVFKKSIGIYENPFVLSSDTIVVVDDKILGKPKDEKEAKEMLKTLSGRSHDVITAVYLKSHKLESLFNIKTKVYFDEIEDSHMDRYIKTGEPMDKAGSYGIQAMGLSFVNKIEGSYSNVVGLPVNEVLKEIKKLIKTNYNISDWRMCFE